MLSEDLVKQIRRLQIYTNRAVDELFAGEYHSAFKGQGMEFAEVREYQPGDDVRTIDWNVTARTGKPYIKRFEEERELTVMLCVDLSASGDFGSKRRSKSQLAAELCAVLAYTAVRNNDKVGLLVFTDQVELFISPKKGGKHVVRVIREVLSFKPTHRGTDIASALEYLSKVLDKKAIVFLISDFFDHGYQTSLKLLNRRHDVISLALVDPREKEMPPLGLIELEDAETGERRIVDTSSRRVRREHARQARERHNALTTDHRRMGIDLVEVENGVSYVNSLMTFFRMRERRR